MMSAEEIYETLLSSYGQPPWWSDDPYLVMVQAVLVQNTNWPSVKKVTETAAGLLTPARVLGMKAAELEALIRPCGCEKRKAAAISSLTEWYRKYDFDTEAVKAMALERVRSELLAVKGVGAETADAILVYAFYKPSFVIDAYTRRFLARLGYCFGGDDAIRAFFEADLNKDASLYGRYHWLILEHGINRCKKTPVCGRCQFASVCENR